MPLIPEKRASILHICWACRGTGVTFHSIVPLKYRPCWACYGRGGRTVELWKLDEADA